MKTYLSIFIIFLIVASCGKPSTAPSRQLWSISTMVNGHSLTLSSSSKYAGAISSVNWNGKEFINSYDHGRELQSAVSFDGLGECYNPTEAGSESNDTSDTTTSKLLYYITSGNQIMASTQMAFWTNINQPYPAGCGTDTSIKTAQNNTNLSGVILTKQITIGFAGIENVIEYLVTYDVPEHHTAATFESLTGYLAVDFSAFWTYDPATGVLESLSAGPGEQNMPVILSTTDLQYAMGIYSPDLPQAAWGELGYGRHNFLSQNTMKWNAVFRRYDTPPGNYSFRLYVVIGTLSDVTKGMSLVYQHFYP